MVNDLIRSIGMVPHMIYFQYEYSSGTVRAFRDMSLEFEMQCTLEEATEQIKQRYGVDPRFAPLVTE